MKENQFLELCDLLRSSLSGLSGGGPASPLEEIAMELIDFNKSQEVYQIRCQLIDMNKTLERLANSIEIFVGTL